MDSSSHSNIELSIYFDGLCPVCAKEINVYRKRDVSGKLRFVDISASSFSASSEGVGEKEVNEVFHVKTGSGQLITGVDGFVKIWDVLDIFRPLKFLAEAKLTRPLFDIGYILFTKIRPYIRRTECDDGVCRT